MKYTIHHYMISSLCRADFESRNVPSLVPKELTVPYIRIYLVQCAVKVKLRQVPDSLRLSIVPSSYSVLLHIHRSISSQATLRTQAKKMK